MGSKHLMLILPLLTIWLHTTHTDCFTITDLDAEATFDNGRSATKVSHDDTQSLLSRLPRSHFRRQPLPINDVANNIETSVMCPTERCYCLLFKDNRYNINCKYQQLDAIPSFNKSETLYYELTFNTYNSITTIPYHAFHNVKVERIDLLTNKLSSIESGAFAGLESYLKELYIEGNGVMPVPYEKMLNLVNLRSLHLKSFEQTVISRDNYFSYFPNLEMLLMEDIKGLRSIDSQAFVNKLGKLKHLRFKEVPFTQLPMTGLSHLKQLTTLEVQDTDIKTIYDGSFRELDNLRSVDLSYNKIDLIQGDAFIDISHHLKSLILSNNYLNKDSLTALSSKPWNNLNTLSISYNSDLRDFPQGVFRNMPQLQYLNLVETNIKIISTNLFAGLNDLHSLDLSWNKIESIGNDPFKHMSKLKQLKLDNQFNNGFTIPFTSITQLSKDSFRGIENSLQILELQNTPLIQEQFWRVVPTLVELTELYATQTKVSYIPEYIFDRNVKLQVLEFGKNNVKLKPTSFKGLEKSLAKISLKDNGLTIISDCNFRGFTNLTDIDLVGNPLHCDCALTWLQQFIQQREKNMNYLQKEYYVCETPSQFKGRKLYNISSNDMSCSNYMPSECNFSKQTSTPSSTTMESSSSTITVTPPSVSISFSLAGITPSSVTVAWSVSDKTSVTGYILEYFQTSSSTTISVPIHREAFTFTIQNLQPATFYTVCLTPEINDKQNKIARTCQTIQTKLTVVGPDGQVGGDPDSSDTSNLSRNTTIGIGLASAAVFILVLVGVCMVVKYKMQKLKLIQWSIGRQTAGMPLDKSSLEDGLDKTKFGAIANDYMEIDNAKLIQKHKGKNGKGKQDQLDEDPTYTDRKKYASCKKVAKKRRNPYENDDESDEDHLAETEDDKVELQLRHSAPSRLEAKGLLNFNRQNSRPLPATPLNKMDTKTLDRKSNTPKDTNTARVFVTQASVYENNAFVAEEGKERQSVYNEIPQKRPVKSKESDIETIKESDKEEMTES